MWVSRITLFISLAGSLTAQPALQEPEGLLEKIRTQVGESLLRLPDYTCLETIERFERSIPSKPFILVDRVRLEVALVEGKEYFAWPGETRFEVSRISRLVPAGTIGNGNFALHAYGVFLSREPVFLYMGEAPKGGKRLLRYDFRVPQARSGYTLRVSGRQAIVGFHGSFYVDRESLNLTRLEVVADEIPDRLGLEQAVDAMEYAPVQIGGSVYTLPSSSELLLRLSDGTETRNVTSFSRCRHYTGESTLSFGAPVEENQTATAPETALVFLPRSTSIELALETPVDSTQSAVGDVVEARLISDIKQNGQVVAPKGSRLTGRIIRLIRLPSPVVHYELGIRFQIVDFQKGKAHFDAGLEAVLTPGGGNTYQGGAARLPNPGNGRSVVLVAQSEEGPGAGLLIVTGERLRLPRGLRMIWRTPQKQGDRRQ